MNAKEFAAGLRAAAEWFEAHPDVPAPCEAAWNVFVDTREEMAAIARQLGSADKNVIGDWYVLRVTAPQFMIEWNIHRGKVCTSRVIGTKQIPETFIPAHAEEILEWDCMPILAETAGA